jgi:drug/metabolite transporter (DMT)-like permease
MSPTVLATATGGVAVLLWATLALFSTLTARLPPLEVVGICFAIAFLIAVVVWLARRQNPLAHLRLPFAVWTLGVGGLFGYHFLYFAALRLAPPLEANLLNYMWPLLIVLFSALLPGERLRWFHIAGAVAGMAGCALLVTRGGGLTIDVGAIPGYLLALGAALAWSSYSVLSRRFGNVPTDAVGAFCLATALLALPSHLLLETTVVPTAQEWLALLALGLGPVGGAFFVWDIGVKHGDIQALGALAYAAPLMSTLLLIATGHAEGSPTVWLACALIVGGAVLAGGALLTRRRPKV